MRLADMMAFAYHEPKKLNRFEADWRSRALGPDVSRETREEMSERADALFAQHSAAMNKRPVS